MLEALHRVVIKVSDLPRAVAFYHHKLQLSLLHRDDATAVLQVGSTEVCLQAQRRDGEKANRFIHLCFAVGDLDAVYARLSEQGIVFGSPPRGRQGSRSAHFWDPEGNELQLVERRQRP